MSSKFTFITPFFQRHGIGFLDVILQAIDDNNGIVSQQLSQIEQYELMCKTLKHGQLNNLERVIYLLPGNYLDSNNIVSLWKEFTSEAKLAAIEESIIKTSIRPNESIADLRKLVTYLNESKDKHFPNYEWLETNWGNHQDLLHIINEFSLKTQIDWYKKCSPIYKNNASIKFEFVELDIQYNQLQEEVETTSALKKWLSHQDLDIHTYVNLWGVATSFQIALYCLSWSTTRLKNVHFLKCCTHKISNIEQRFTPLNIVPVNKDLLADLESMNHKLTGLSTQQQDTFKWLKQYKEFEDNFTIMLLGPRGIGKTKVVKEVYGSELDCIISVNCAQFQSNPELARSELFGHVEGSFTGANTTKDGAFTQANGKVLFLDEIHHLDKATQSMLLTALQTDNKGYFHYTPLGADRPKASKFQLIVASNLEENKLKGNILNDLLDRISQRLLTFSPLIAGPAIADRFTHVWNEMDFKGVHNNPLEDMGLEFKNWLTDRNRVFSGNYRDLQKISILCADYQRCKNNSDLIHKGTSLVNYIQANWREKLNEKEDTIENFFNENNHLSIKAMTNEFKAKLVQAAEFHSGDIKSAAKMLGITPKNIIEIKKRYQEQ
ncbi:sigma 54-interacting transcriptional regulator [Shewanella sp. 4_MG-2023]|uniref:sigma 54-interacting transcriptional regulator n=1 Tax=Shewanella sp. 4_MG-2023 TaxID=3062652 RepID=UPI0026E48AA7|nr:sigma 54-interacting transcriptional regulator [Shewanella sp. 4_MG-2023]MDO6677645.1 sigma 54-interacting transcriptional regulator [Shewanella sp. 4_MG-2023]